MIKVFKLVSAKSKKYNRANSYFNGTERIGYEVKRIPEDELSKALSKGWSRELPTKVAKKVQADVITDNQDSDIITSTESSGSTDSIQESE